MRWNVADSPRPQVRITGSKKVDPRKTTRKRRSSDEEEQAPMTSYFRYAKFGVRDADVHIGSSGSLASALLPALLGLRRRNRCTSRKAAAGLEAHSEHDPLPNRLATVMSPPII